MDGRLLPSDEEELFIGPARTRPRRWWLVGGVGLLGVAAASTALLTTAGHGAAPRSDAAPASSDSPAAAATSAPALAVIDTLGAVAARKPPRPAGGTTAAEVLNDQGEHMTRDSDGAVTWTLRLRNLAGQPIQLSKPLHLYVAVGLRARVVGVVLLDKSSPVTPGTYVEQDHVMRLQVHFAFDCRDVDTQATAFPPISARVDIALFGYAGTASYVLPSPPGKRPWQRVCPYGDTS